MRISDWSSDVCSSDLTLQASSPPPWNCLRQLLPTSFPDQDLQARRQDRRRPTRRSWSGFWKIDCSELRSALSPRWPRMREYRPLTDVRLRRTQQIGRAHVRTPVTTAHLVCRLLHEQTKIH